MPAQDGNRFLWHFPRYVCTLGKNILFISPVTSHLPVSFQFVKVNSTSVTSGRAFFQASNLFDDLSWLVCNRMSLFSTHPLKTAYLKKDDLGLQSIKSGGEQFFSMFGPQQIA